jgi:hypothetical protein
VNPLYDSFWGRGWLATVSRADGGVMMGRMVATVVFAGMILAPAMASAQARAEIRVMPRAGMVTPADWFYVEFASFGSGPLDWTEAAITRAPVVGLTAEVSLDHLGLWIRAEALRTVGGRTTIIHAILYPASQVGPGQVVRTRWDVPSTLTTGTVDLGLPLRLRLPGGIQPYVTAGIGAKRYGFDLAALDGREERIVRPAPGTVPVFNAGVGAVMDIRGVRLDLLVRDALSEYWGEQQHDVTFLAGLGIRVR